MADLTFEPESHTYRVGGIVVPSVTQVLDRFSDFDGVPADVLEAARIFGTHVHEACHLMVRDELDWDSLDANLLPYVLGAKRFLDESGMVVLDSEKRVYSKRLKVAGTLDIRGILRDSYAVIDWKATAAMPVTVGPQTAAYEELYREEHGGTKHKRFCVQLRPNDYRVKPLTDTRDFNIFVSALNCYHFFGSKRREH